MVTVHHDATGQGKPDDRLPPPTEHYRHLGNVSIAPHVDMPDYGKYSAFMRRGTMERYRIDIDPAEGAVTWTSGDKKPVRMRAWWAPDDQHPELPTVKELVMVHYSSLLSRAYTVGKVLAVDDTGRTLASTYEYRHSSLRQQWLSTSSRLAAHGLPLTIEPMRRWPMSGPWSVNRRHRRAVKGLWYRSFPFMFLTSTVMFVLFLVLLAVVSR